MCAVDDDDPERARAVIGSGQDLPGDDQIECLGGQAQRITQDEHRQRDIAPCDEGAHSSIQLRVGMKGALEIGRIDLQDQPVDDVEHHHEDRGDAKRRSPAEGCESDTVGPGQIPERRMYHIEAMVQEIAQP